MKRFLLLACASVLLTSASGCAIGREQSFETTSLNLHRTSAGSSVAFAVHDQRAEVVSGDKDPDFVGLSRGGFGNTFDVTTESDAPLADDFAAVIGRGLTQAGYRVTAVPVTHHTQPQEAVQKLAQSGAKHLLLIKILRWKSDTYQNTALDYHLEAIVVDRRGKLLSRCQRQGRDNLGGNMWNPGAHADEAVPEAFQKKLDELLNDPEIARALHGDAVAVARASTPGT